MAQSPAVNAPHDLLRLVSRKYTLQILSLLETDDPMRYSDIEATVDARSSSTFADHMASLVDAELVERHWYDEIPPRVEYTLTDRGREFLARVEPLREWATRD